MYDPTLHKINKPSWIPDSSPHSLDKCPVTYFGIGAESTSHHIHNTRSKCQHSHYVAACCMFYMVMWFSQAIIWKIKKMMKFVNLPHSTFTQSTVDGVHVQDPPYYIFLLLNYYLPTSKFTCMYQTLILHVFIFMWLNLNYLHYIKQKQKSYPNAN